MTRCENFSASSDSSATIERLAEELFGDGIDHHVAGSSIERDDILDGSRARADRGKVGDAANILHDSSDMRIAKKQ